jgi:pimeloyl-ACP methyl ester carboxylesterase
MSSFVLVHGSWHGAWCWYKVVPRLRALGHYVAAVDLPGHGRDRTEPAAITLDSYADRIAEAIDQAPGKVVVVAHSRGGVPTSQAAERRHERIEHVVYLAAYLLADGETVLDHAPHDGDSLVIPNLSFDPDGHWDMLNADAFEPALYADCAREDVVLAHLLLTPEPALPSRTRISISDQRYGTIPRTYIELLEDRAVTPMLQKRMHSAMPCDHVRSIDASHSAYFSKPDELTRHLDEIAALTT